MTTEPTTPTGRLILAHVRAAAAQAYALAAHEHAAASLPASDTRKAEHVGKAETARASLVALGVDSLAGVPLTAPEPEPTPKEPPAEEPSADDAEAPAEPAPTPTPADVAKRTGAAK